MKPASFYREIFWIWADNCGYIFDSQLNRPYASIQEFRTLVRNAIDASK